MKYTSSITKRIILNQKTITFITIINNNNIPGWNQLCLYWTYSCHFVYAFIYDRQDTKTSNSYYYTCDILGFHLDTSFLLTFLALVMSLNSCSEKNHGISPDHFEYDVSFLPASHVWFHLLKCKNCFVDFENTISMTKCAMYMILNYNPFLCLRWPLIWIDCFSIKESRDAIISVLEKGSSLTLKIISTAEWMKFYFLRWNRHQSTWK